MKQAQGGEMNARAAGKRKAMPMAAGNTARPAHHEDAPSVELRIHTVAYALYEARGCVDGHDLDDWLAAEEAVAREVQGARSEDAGADH